MLLGLLLVLIGIAGLTYPFWPINRSYDSDSLSIINDAFEFEASQISSISADFDDIASTIATSTTNGDDPVLANMKNRLLIPKIDVNMPLIVSNNIDALELGGWIFPKGSHPDKQGNTIIIGHQFKYRPPINNTFFNLSKVSVGDIFSILWNSKKYTYKVSETKIVDPDDVSVLQNSDKWQVTLITCYPAFSVKQRFVVVADLVVIE